jgi:hypothetical protein
VFSRIRATRPWGALHSHGIELTAHLPLPESLADLSVFIMVFTVGTGGYFAWKEAVGEAKDDVAKNISGPFPFLLSLKLLRGSFNSRGLNMETRDRRCQERRLRVATTELVGRCITRISFLVLDAKAFI